MSQILLGISRLILKEFSNYFYRLPKNLIFHPAYYIISMYSTYLTRKQRFHRSSPSLSWAYSFCRAIQSHMIRPDQDFRSQNDPHRNLLSIRPEHPAYTCCCRFDQSILRGRRADSVALRNSISQEKNRSFVLEKIKTVNLTDYSRLNDTSRIMSGAHFNLVNRLENKIESA